MINGTAWSVYDSCYLLWVDEWHWCLHDPCCSRFSLAVKMRSFDLFSINFDFSNDLYIFSSIKIKIIFPSWFLFQILGRYSGGEYFVLRGFSLPRSGQWVWPFTFEQLLSLCILKVLPAVWLRFYGISQSTVIWCIWLERNAHRIFKASFLLFVRLDCFWTVFGLCSWLLERFF